MGEFPRYPQIAVQLTGTDGNVFAILGAVQRALRDAGVPDQDVNAFTTEATTSGSYDGVLQTCMRWVEVA